MLRDDLTIVSGSWQDLARDAQLIREAVFIQEQHIDPKDEWDEYDPLCLHFVVYLKQQAIATARLLSNHRIGRVAVLKQYRGQGIGHHLMKAIIKQAVDESRPYLHLSSQVHAIEFYQALGFISQGDSYLDCGIPHIDMCMNF